jgi:hypothetical protein
MVSPNPAALPPMGGLSVLQYGKKAIPYCSHSLFIA